MAIGLIAEAVEAHIRLDRAKGEVQAWGNKLAALNGAMVDAEQAEVTRQLQVFYDDVKAEVRRQQIRAKR